jgi:gluconolactonase
MTSLPRLAPLAAALCLVWASACSSSGKGAAGGAGTGGAAGTAGGAGTSGAAGATGAAGTMGAAGTVGAAGTSGAAGTTGAAGKSAPDAGSDAPRDTAASDTGVPDAPPTMKIGPAGGVCPPGATTGSPLPQVRTAKLIRGGFRELEGPVWVASQHALYFCEMGATPTTGHINKYTPADGKIVAFVDNIGVGGLALDPQGQLVAATYDKLRLSRIDPVTGARTEIPGAASYMGKPFNEVNDVVVRADGNMYFSDPGYGAGAGNQDAAAFYRLSPAGVVSRITAAKDSNGVALSPDGAWLYLSTTGGPALQRFALAADGTPSAGTTWKAPESDGMAVDCAGNVYLTADKLVKVVSPDDAPLGQIDGLGTSYVTNAAFGGEDRKTLFITTGAALYQIELAVPGFPN